jgi:hypothetical protein
MRIELIDCERVLLKEIKDPSMTRRDVAKTYALTIRSSVASDRVDWTKVNSAIIARWSPSALVWIKEQAWSGKCFDGGPR